MAERRRLAKWDQWYLDKGALDRLLTGRGDTNAAGNGTRSGRSKRSKKGSVRDSVATLTWTRPSSRALEFFFGVGGGNDVAVRIPRFVSTDSPRNSPKMTGASAGSGAQTRGAGPGGGGQQRLPAYLQLDSLQADGQRAFVVAFHNELTKVNALFIRRISELQKELHFIESQVTSRPNITPDIHSFAAAHNPNSRLLRSTASLQRAVADLYRQCNDLDSFCLYNTLSCLDVCTHIRMMRFSYQQLRKQQAIDALNKANADDQTPIVTPIVESVDVKQPVGDSPALLNLSAAAGLPPLLDAVALAGAMPVAAVGSSSSSSAAVAIPAGARPASNTVTSLGGDAAADATTPAPKLSMSPIVRRDVGDGGPAVRPDSALASGTAPAAMAGRTSPKVGRTSPKVKSAGAAAGAAASSQLAFASGDDDKAKAVSGGELKVESIIKNMLDRTDFFNRAALVALQQQVERCYATAFTDGRLTDAHASLQGSVRTPFSWLAFGTGLRFGAFLLLVFWVLWDCLLDARDLSEDVSSAWSSRIVPVYRACGYWIVFYWLFGSLIWVTHKFRINLALLFDLPSDYRLDYRAVLHHATGLSIVWCVNFLVHFKMLLGQIPNDVIPEGCFPIALMFYLAYRTLYPWGPAKFWLRVIWQVVSAPFSHVTFVTVWVGDVLTSFTRPLNDAAFTSCFFFAGYWTQFHQLEDSSKSCAGDWTLTTVVSPLMSALPLWFRFLQCLRRYYDTNARWPHLGNAGKYALSMTVALIGLTLPTSSGGGVIDGNSATWLALLILSTCYTFSWDVWMDWGLGAGCCRRTRRCCHSCGCCPLDDGSGDRQAPPSGKAAAGGVNSTKDGTIAALPDGGDRPYTPLPPSPSDDTPVAASGSSAGVGGGLQASASTPLLKSDHMGGSSSVVGGGSLQAAHDPYADGDDEHAHMHRDGACCGPCADSESCNACAHDCYLMWGRNLHMFRARWPYYVAIVLDLCLRFSWTLTLVPANALHLLGPHLQLYLTPALGFAELFRRTAWSYLRLENEHLSRVQGIPTPDPTFIPKHILIPASTPGGGRSDEPLIGLDERPNDPTATNGEEGEGDGDDTPVAALAAPRNVLLEVGVWAVLVILAAVIIYVTRK